MSDIFIAVESGKSKRILTEGKLCSDNIVVTGTGSESPGLPDPGYAAVGYVDTLNNKACLLFQNGTVQYVSYTGDAPKEGAVHKYSVGDNGEFAFSYLVGNLQSTPADQLTQPGMAIFGQSGAFWMWTQEGKLFHYDMRNVPIFIRYSTTEWRLASVYDVVPNNGTVATLGYFLDCKQSDGYVDADNQRWHTVGALVIGSADQYGILPPALEIFGNVQANVILAAPSGENDIYADIFNAATLNGTNFAYLFYFNSSITESPIPRELTHNVTTYKDMHFRNSNLVIVPDYDYSKAINVTRIFSGTGISSFPSTDFPVCTDFFQPLQGCKSLKTVGVLGTSKCKEMGQIFMGDSALETIEGIDFSSATNIEAAFNSAQKIANVTINGTIPVSITLPSAVLTVESAKSVINALVDYSGTDKEFTYSVSFHADVIAALEAEGATAPNRATWIEFATAKGWNI